MPCRMKALPDVPWLIIVTLLQQLPDAYAMLGIVSNGVHCDIIGAYFAVQIKIINGCTQKQQIVLCRFVLIIVFLSLEETSTMGSCEFTLDQFYHFGLVVLDDHG